MQVILTASDFATMPTPLRQELLAYLATRRKSAAPSTGRRRRASESEMFDGLAPKRLPTAAMIPRGRSRSSIRLSDATCQEVPPVCRSLGLRRGLPLRRRGAG